ncbi:MAG: AN1-type zinc finger domain-containing protein [Promethearchaeati archaeon]
MPYCEYCGEEIGFLPFKCKYCGGIFCKEHRLPENHECTFERKHRPTVPTSRRGEKREQERYRFVSTEEDPKKVKKFMKKQDKQRDRARKLFESGISGYGGTSITTYLIIAIFIASIMGSIMPEFLCLSSSSFFKLYIWTFLTAPFVNVSEGFFGMFFLLIIILLFYNIIRIIELRFGSKFLITLYLFSTFISALIYISIWVPIEFASPTRLSPWPIGLAFGGLLGIISFMIYFSFDKEMTFLLMFIPIRMKGKIILLLLILFSLVPGLLFYLLTLEPIYLAIYIPDLGGILGSYIIFRYKFRYIR